MKVKFTNPLMVNFAMLNNALSKDDLRPVMCHVCIDLKEKKLVVTDAHILVAYPIEITENETNCEDMLLVPPRFFNHLKYMMDIPKKNLELIEYVLTKDFAEVYFGEDLVYRCRYFEGTYRKWTAIIPVEEKSQPIKSIGLNHNVLKKLCSALPNAITGYEFIFTAQNKGVLLKPIDSENKTIAVIMPLMLNK